MRKSNFTYLTWRMIPEKIHFLFLLAHYGVDLEDNYIGMPVESNKETWYDEYKKSLDKFDYSKEFIEKLEDGKNKVRNLLPLHPLKKWDDERAKQLNINLDNSSELASYKYGHLKWVGYGYMKACMHSKYVIVWESTHRDNSIMFTEKTWIPIFCGTPILFMYKPGALQKFKSHGYKSWPMIFDESYDKIESTEERLDMLARQVKELETKTDQYFQSAGLNSEWNKLWSWKRDIKNEVY